MVLHVIANKKALENYFTKPVFISVGVLILILTTTFAVVSKNSMPINRLLINNIITSPISSSFVVLNQDFNRTKAKIQSYRIIIGDANMIEEISKKNNIPVTDILEQIIE